MGALPIESVVGGLLEHLKYAESGELTLVLRPGIPGSKKPRPSGEPIRLQFVGLENAERVKRFFFRRRWKPFGEWQDQVVGVSLRQGSLGIEFANAGRVRVRAEAIILDALDE